MDRCGGIGEEVMGETILCHNSVLKTVHALCERWRGETPAFSAATVMGSAVHVGAGDKDAIAFMRW